MSTPEAPLPEGQPALETPAEQLLRFFPAFPAWSWIDLLGITILTLLALLVSIVCVFMVASLASPGRGATIESGNLPALSILAQAIAYGVMLAYIGRVLRRCSGESALVALHWNPRPASLGTGVVGGLVLAFATIWLQGQMPVPKQLPVEELFKGTWTAYAFAVFAVLLAPLFEEVYFRGLLFPLLRKQTGHWVAVVLTSVAFALIHGVQLAFSWSALALVFFVGLVLTIVRARLGSVAASWMVHVAYNTTLMVMTWIATGHFRQLS